MKHSVANVPSQQAVKLEVLGPFVSLSNVAVDCIWETSGNEKWDELGELQSVTLTLELSLKMSYFPDYYEESLTFDIFKTDTSIN